MFGRWRHIDIATILILVDAWLGSGHRPSMEHGNQQGIFLREEEEDAALLDEDFYAISRVFGNKHVDVDMAKATGIPCEDKSKDKCCKEPTLKDIDSTVEGCTCVCKALDYKDEWKKVQSRVDWYRDAGYPVDDKTDNPDYSTYARNHIDSKYTNEKGVLKGVDLPAVSSQVGSQYGAWEKEFDKGLNKSGGKVKDKEWDKAEHLLTNQASEKLTIGSTNVPLIDPATKMTSEALKGQWRDAVHTLGMDAYNMRMMAEEELLALRDFLLKACVNCDEKVKTAKEALHARRLEYEEKMKNAKDLEPRPDHETVHETAHDAHHEPNLYDS